MSVNEKFRFFKAKQRAQNDKLSQEIFCDWFVLSSLSDEIRARKCKISFGILGEPFINPSLSRMSTVLGVTLMRMNRLEKYTRRLKVSNLTIISFTSNASNKPMKSVPKELMTIKKEIASNYYR